MKSKHLLSNPRGKETDFNAAAQLCPCAHTYIHHTLDAKRRASGNPEKQARKKSLLHVLKRNSSKQQAARGGRTDRQAGQRRASGSRETCVCVRQPGAGWLGGGFFPFACSANHPVAPSIHPNQPADGWVSDVT